MCIAWSRSIDDSGSMVTSGMSVRSRSGSRGAAAAARAASSTWSGKSEVTCISAWIVSIPSRSARPGTLSALVRTLTTRLLGMDRP
jgi:hypothetical protein